MRNSILIDAGLLIALFDKDDKYHTAVKEFVRKGRFDFFATTAVMTEVTRMPDFNVNAQIFFLDLIEEYGDLPMDFADATLVVAAEKTGIGGIISVDSDFIASVDGRAPPVRNMRSPCVTPSRVPEPLSLAR